MCGIRPALAIFALLALPAVAMAEVVMIPGAAYEIRISASEAARVIFHPDHRVLVWEGEATTPEHQGDWTRRDGQICITEGSEFGALCMDERAGAGGAFRLVVDGRSMDFTPLP